ncbi:MAG TPA: HNH endonuclease [Flavobacterium alvei]|nr:HNH endonuclease [Flavobacterium alvei]
MEIIVYECLKGFHRRFIESEKNPELQNINAFADIMQGDFSGKNLIGKIIATDEYWQKMLNTKGFGRGVKYDKVLDYRKKLTEAWNIIKETFDTKNEVEISKLMGLYLWDMEEDKFTHSYLGVIEEAIKQNKLWKNPAVSDIFFTFLVFIPNALKTLDEIAQKNNLDRERVRQLKVESLNNFEQDFWFLKDTLIKEKLENIFDVSSHNFLQIREQTKMVNEAEEVHFTSHFYTKTLSIVFDMLLIGDINEITNKNKRNSNGNIWSNLYLQTQLENERFDIKRVIDSLAIEMYKNNDRFVQDKVIDISGYATIPLTQFEIESYNSIIAEELILKTEIKEDKVIIKRTSHITQPEIVETVLRELGGFAYADDILKKVIENHPEKDWTMPVLRTSLLRGEVFYSVGKSALFGLNNVKDVRDQMGSGTLNDVISIYMSRKDSPIHIHELLEHINNLFPRPKKLLTVQAILEQDSKQYFVKFEGGFYGLGEKDYQNTEFPKVKGGHGKYLKQIIKISNGIGFEKLSEDFNNRYGLLEIQVKYLLDLMIETYGVSLKDGLYYPFTALEIPETVENDNFEISAEETDLEIDEEELDFDELNQPDVPEEFIKDVLAQIKVRRGQPKFRQKLLKLYKRTCIVTGCKIPELLEAAHILPHSVKKDFSLSNGLLLRTDIHTLFDLDMIAINPENMRLKLKSTLIESSEYAGLNDIDIGLRITKLHQSYKISEEGLFRRWETFIESE